MIYRVLHEPAANHARSPFRIVEQTTGREVDWVNRLRRILSAVSQACWSRAAVRRERHTPPAAAPLRVRQADRYSRPTRHVVRLEGGGKNGSIRLIPARHDSRRSAGLDGALERFRGRVSRMRCRNHHVPSAFAVSPGAASPNHRAPFYGDQPRLCTWQSLALEKDASLQRTRVRSGVPPVGLDRAIGHISNEQRRNCRGRSEKWGWQEPSADELVSRNVSFLCFAGANAGPSISSLHLGVGPLQLQAVLPCQRLQRNVLCG